LRRSGVLGAAHLPLVQRAPACILTRAYLYIDASPDGPVRALELAALHAAVTAVPSVLIWAIYSGGPSPGKCS